MSSKAVQEILKKFSFQNYYVEYNVYFSNHSAHAIIALDRLGANPERIEEYMQYYLKDIANLSPPSRDKKVDLSPEEIMKRPGTMNSYYTRLTYYQDLLKQTGSVDKLIQQEFPKLMNGVVGAALHGLIQLGYGYSAGNEDTMCEGLAYLHFASNPLNMCGKSWDDGPEDTDILDILNIAREDEKLMTKVKEKYDPNFTDSHLTKWTHAILWDCGEEITDLVNRIRLPSPSSSESGINDGVQLASWLVDCAIQVYTQSSCINEFFLLHGVTGAWSLLQVVHLLSDYKQQRDAVKYFLAALISVYIAVGRPKFSIPLNTEKYVSSDEVWSNKIADLIKVDVNEHVYKLVQVCNDMHKNCDDEKKGSMYLQAACSSIENPFTSPFKEESKYFDGELDEGRKPQS